MAQLPAFDDEAFDVRSRSDGQCHSDGQCVLTANARSAAYAVEVTSGYDELFYRNEALTFDDVLSSRLRRGDDQTTPISAPH